LWSAGADGGSVTPVAELPEPNASVPEARMSANGTSLVFQTTERLSSSFNSGGYEQIYRYDVPANTLGCVSCDPAGLTPRGDAELSPLLTAERPGHGHEDLWPSLDQRGISSDGERIFFDSPDPLVPQDANTNSPAAEVSEGAQEPQGRDVYEWENGVVYLISTGQSSRDSYLLDSSENGDDVFFATTQSLVSADTDGGYDIYDARIPRSGETPALPPSACAGSSCQGTVNNGPPATTPAGSASFTGMGNLVPEVTPSAPVSSPPKPVKCKKGYVKKANKCVKPKKKTSGRHAHGTNHGTKK
jgi:hypothetical protein